MASSRFFIADLQDKWRNNIRVRHTVGLSIVILVIMSIGSAAMLYQQRATIRQAAEARGLAFNRTFALMGAAAVLDNLFRVQEAMNRIIQDPDILEIDVIDPSSMIVAARHTKRIGTILRDQDWIAPPKSQQEIVTYSTDAEGEPLLVIVEPLLDEGKIAAWTRVVFSLSQVRRFPSTAYLAPEPTEPFIALTQALACRFPEFQPFRGEHDSIVPHLTVANGNAREAEIAAAELEAVIKSNGSISSFCSSVSLLENSSGRWREMHVFPLARQDS